MTLGGLSATTTLELMMQMLLAKILDLKVVVPIQALP